MQPVLSELPQILPTGESGWAYYVICSLFFLVSGIACGYFIWRKGHMQTIDAEMEVHRTEQDLQMLREDLSLEEKEISSQNDPAAEES